MTWLAIAILAGEAFLIAVAFIMGGRSEFNRGLVKGRQEGYRQAARSMGILSAGVEDVRESGAVEELLG